jgi:hypothetical protein
MNDTTGEPTTPGDWRGPIAAQVQIVDTTPELTTTSSVYMRPGPAQAYIRAQYAARGWEIAPFLAGFDASRGHVGTTPGGMLTYTPVDLQQAYMYAEIQGPALGPGCSAEEIQARFLELVPQGVQTTENASIFRL